VLAKEEKKNQLKKQNRKKKDKSHKKVCILALETGGIGHCFWKNYHN